VEDETSLWKLKEKQKETAEATSGRITSAIAKRGWASLAGIYLKSVLE
jgi:hypothetical protein